MSLRCVSRVTIGNFRFNYTTNIQIMKSFDTMTDTATITMPNKFLKDNKSITVGTDNVFNRNDAVKIECGYFPNLKTEFEGFISKIMPGSPLKIECQDRMYLLKQKNIDSKSFTNTTIGEVIKHVAPDEDIDFDDENAHIGDFSIDNKSFINAVSVFQEIKKQFGFKVFFKAGRLQVRILPSILSQTGDEINVGFQKHVIDYNLQYIKEEDVDLVIKAESILDDNTRIVLYGKKVEGKVSITKVKQNAAQTKPLAVYNFTEVQLKAEIERRIDDYIFEGYTGKFTMFFEPSVDPEDKVILTDYKNKERTGTYLIKSITKEFGTGGGRQIVEPRNKVA